MCVCIPGTFFDQLCWGIPSQLCIFQTCSIKCHYTTEIMLKKNDPAGTIFGLIYYKTCLFPPPWPPVAFHPRLLYQLYEQNQLKGQISVDWRSWYLRTETTLKTLKQSPSLSGNRLFWMFHLRYYPKYFRNYFQMYNWIGSSQRDSGMWITRRRSHHHIRHGGGMVITAPVPLATLRTGTRLTTLHRHVPAASLWCTAQHMYCNCNALLHNTKLYCCSKRC